jgi:hypothetical protein
MRTFDRAEQILEKRKTQPSVDIDRIIQYIINRQASKEFRYTDTLPRSHSLSQNIFNFIMVHYSCVSLLLLLVLPSSVFGFLGPNPHPRAPSTSSKTTESQSRPHIQYVHSSVVSPFSPQLANLEAASVSEIKLKEDMLPTDDDDSDSSDQLGNLYRMLGATPKDSLRLESTISDGVRGVYLSKPVLEGEVIVSIPLEACLSDESESVPQWMMMAALENDEENDDGYNPSSWATRLAASLIDLQLQSNQNQTETTGNVNPGHKLWLSMLPDPDLLQASLPVHWGDDMLQSARCTALELAGDSAYFARAEAIEDLVFALTNYCEYEHGKSADELRTMCDEALDIVQTRTCRLDRGLSNDNDGRTYGPPLRVLAPIFDLINHGSANNRGESGANAQFALEGDDDEQLLMTKDGRLVVRAMRDLRQGDEVLIDYGPSTRPAWRCLLSYGFVPSNRRILAPGESISSSSSSNLDDEEDEENVAEVYMDGIRFEVGPFSIPVDMVAAAMASLREQGSGGAIGAPLLDDNDDGSEIALTPEVALRIAERISDVADQLILEPERDMHDDNPAAKPTTFQVISNQLVASLRFSQHRVLLACALGLKDCVTEETSYL